MQLICDKNGKIKIEWTYAEKKIHKSISQFIKQPLLTSNAKINFLLNFDMPLIILLAEENLEFFSWLQQQDLADYWQKAWKLLSRSPSWPEAQQDKKLVYRELISQPNISCFNLVRGMCFLQPGK